MAGRLENLADFLWRFAPVRSRILAQCLTSACTRMRAEALAPAHLIRFVKYKELALEYQRLGSCQRDLLQIVFVCFSSQPAQLFFFCLKSLFLTFVVHFGDSTIASEVKPSFQPIGLMVKRLPLLVS